MTDELITKFKDLKIGDKFFMDTADVWQYQKTTPQMAMRLMVKKEGCVGPETVVIPAFDCEKEERGRDQ